MVMPLHALVGLLLFWQGASNSFDVLVVDGSSRPIPGVRVELKAGGVVVASTRTDEKGRAEFRDLEAARCELFAAKEGFEPIESNVELPASVTLTMRPARRESVEVKRAAAPLEARASAPIEVPAQTVKELPGRPPTL